MGLRRGQDQKAKTELSKTMKAKKPTIEMHPKLYRILKKAHDPQGR